MLMRARTAAASISIISGGDALQRNQLIGGQRAGAEAADGERGAVERQGRNDGVDAGTVGQARIDHGRRLIDPAAHARDDAIDDLQQMAIVAKDRICFAEQAAAFDEDLVFAVHQDVGDGRITEQRFQRTKAEDLVEQIAPESFSCSPKLRGTLWSRMISLTMVETACRAWPELTRDSFSRSSLEIRVRCISVLNFSRLSCSTLYRPSDYRRSRSLAFSRTSETLLLVRGWETNCLPLWPSAGSPGR